jgi:hypothetical protein
MKKVVLFFSLLIPAVSFAQPYSIDWHTISGGGGTSSGGNYSISGTIGQHDASMAPMTGGDYSLTGGFWSFISVLQSAGAPVLAIRYSSNRVIVSWPSSAANYVLQQNSDVTTTNWTISNFTVNDEGATNSITIAAPTGNLFFRLQAR